jgi:hypothetical protein
MKAWSRPYRCLLFSLIDFALLMAGVGSRVRADANEVTLLSATRDT